MIGQGGLSRNFCPGRLMLALVAASGLITACVADTTRVKDKVAMVTAGISAAQNADTILDMPVLFSVTNNGAEAVELLKWNTPLEKILSADIFSVERDEEAVAYIGRTMKRASPGAGDFIVLDAGATTEALIDIARYYDTREPGTYEIRFLPPGGEEGYANNGVAVSLDPVVVTFIK